VSPLRLLLVEDNLDDAELMVAELVRAGFEPDWSRVDSTAGLKAALYPPPDLILADYQVPGLDALEVLNLLRARGLTVPVIVVSGAMDEETCVKSLRMGAVDYLLKDRLVRLGPAVEHALATRQLLLEKREVEVKERQAAGILGGLVKHAPAAISVKAVDGRYLLANHQFELLCGAPPGGLIGRIDADVFPVERAREMTELDARCLHTSIVLEREEEFPAPAPELAPRSMICVRYPVSDEDGEVFGIGSIYLDITRQKRIETELRAARAEILARADELVTANQQLVEADALKTEFIASVSHELRTPLTSIRGYVEMIEDDADGLSGELGHRFMSIIDRNSQHLLSLIEDLLLLSQMDAGKTREPEAGVSLPEVIADAVAMLLPAVNRAGLNLSVDVPDDLPTVSGRREQLERVMVNLLSNAVKFSPNTGLICVAAQREDGGVRIAVEDRGIGIALEQQDKLFSRFFRSDAARERGIAGTGLGLAVVKGIVEGHGGTIEVDSLPGHGTTFTIHLPAEDALLPGVS
jgi:signal transduction histidine kinase/ActR/RegA family two-component response regulator